MYKRLMLPILLLSFLLGCSSPPPPPIEGLNAFTGFRLIDGLGGSPIERATMVVRDGRIEAVGATADVQIPPGATEIDLNGKIVTPGLIVTHGHVGLARGLESGPQVNTIENVMDQLKLYARYGVTAVVSLGSDGEAGIQIASRQKEAGFDYARLHVAGVTIDTRDPEETVRLVQENHARGVDFIKLRVDDQLGTTQKMTRSDYGPAITEAHKLGLKVAAHLYYLDDAKQLLDAGVDFLAHSIRDQAVDSEVIELFQATNVCITPTLTREMSTYVYATEPEFFSDPFFTKAADPAVLEQLKDPERQQSVASNRAANLYQEGYPLAAQNLKALADAGVRIAFGTDSGPAGRFQGYFEHLEMEMMADAGLTPAQILRSATSEAAACLGLDELGTLEAGKWADFVVLAEDPLADVQNFRSLEATWIGGNSIRP